MPRQYEFAYGIRLLDDIHNLFPEILYDSAAITGIASTSPLIQFIQRRTQSLFPEEYTQSRAYYRLYNPEYRRRETAVRPTWASADAPPQPQPQPRLPRHQHPQPQQTQQPLPQYRTISSATYTIPLITPLATATNQTTDTDATETDISTLLTSVLLRGLGTQNWGDLLTPVTVAPTAEQIAAGSIVSSVEPHRDVTCAICQDHDSPSEEHQEWRILRHCQHRFHRDCIDEWFEQNVHCPVCRHDIRESA